MSDLAFIEFDLGVFQLELLLEQFVEVFREQNLVVGIKISICINALEGPWRLCTPIEGVEVEHPSLLAFHIKQVTELEDHRKPPMPFSESWDRDKFLFVPMLFRKMPLHLLASKDGRRCPSQTRAKA